MEEFTYTPEFYALAEQTDINRACLKELAETDWKVIRELERMFLGGTPLNVEREAIRAKHAAVDWSTI